ncbi:GT2 family glycosyltransferase [Kibdelosporangium banguiense]|uniref:GT2 family glycosyltransferase n=1 Tax=Kibdelosporangium banguiense TaxID=1365924 RepID=A0ABS4TBF4_9PSEU|nr:glycosyltransferase [Kibdelosporangium banguiense]MBP2321757.1 GT2 family glycosyltransferase [Kibdelosporangium banguiense]
MELAGASDLREAEVTPRSVTPLVSVVIVTHGGGELLTRCISALRDNTREAIEVIVLDSASPDGTGEWARRALPDVKVHTSVANHGFGAMSNMGVLDARAPYVCFLNADVTVSPNWLPPLLEVLETQPHVGAVAPLMNNPDGTVQEYGSVVRADGWSEAWTDTSALFRRPVDYASGACLLVRRRAFFEVGGFAPEYHIAYFEDTDLAFALREAGWSTVVEPRSAVVHERHGISGSERALSLMQRNHGIFAAKWARRLATHVAIKPDSPAHHLAHARDLTVLERILVIDDTVPGDPRTRRLVEGLVGRDRLVTFTARYESKEDGHWLSVLGVEVAVVTDISDWLSRRLGCFDVVIVSKPHNWDWSARAIDTYQPQAKRVYDGSPLLGSDLEATAFTWADVAMCSTRTDVDRVIETVSPPTHMHVVGYSSPIVTNPLKARSGVVAFADSVLTEIWPTLHDWDAGLRLTLFSANQTDRPEVEVIGHVPNLPWHLSRARLAIAPARTPGLSTDLVTSMAAGLPFLTNPTGAEGLHLGDLTAHLVAETPADTLKQADKLLTDDILWQDVADHLLDLAAEHFSTRALHRALDETLLTCGLAPAER